MVSMFTKMEVYTKGFGEKVNHFSFRLLLEKKVVFKKIEDNMLTL